MFKEYMKIDELINEIMDIIADQGIEEDSVKYCKLHALQAQTELVTCQIEAFVESMSKVVARLAIDCYPSIAHARQVLTNMFWIANRRYCPQKSEREMYILNRHLVKENKTKALHDAIQALSYIAFEVQEQDYEY